MGTLEGQEGFPNSGDPLSRKPPGFGGIRQTRTSLRCHYAAEAAFPASPLCAAAKVFCNGDGASTVTIEGGTFRDNMALESGGCLLYTSDAADE